MANYLSNKEKKRQKSYEDVSKTLQNLAIHCLDVRAAYNPPIFPARGFFFFFNF